MKENLFLKKRSNSFFLDQEPKITKKKLKNLHLSFDPKLLQNDQIIDKNTKEDLKMNLNINEIEILGEEKEVSENEV